MLAILPQNSLSLILSILLYVCAVAAAMYFFHRYSKRNSSIRNHVAIIELLSTSQSQNSLYSLHEDETRTRAALGTALCVQVDEKSVTLEVKACPCTPLTVGQQVHAYFWLVSSSQVYDFVTHIQRIVNTPYAVHLVCALPTTLGNNQRRLFYRFNPSSELMQLVAAWHMQTGTAGLPQITHPTHPAHPAPTATQVVSTAPQRLRLPIDSVSVRDISGGGGLVELVVSGAQPVPQCGDHLVLHLNLLDTCKSRLDMLLAGEIIRIRHEPVRPLDAEEHATMQVGVHWQRWAQKREQGALQWTTVHGHNGIPPLEMWIMRQNARCSCKPALMVPCGQHVSLQ